ncbi:MAG: sterol desaturase family protein [Bradyrhizobium sp.]|uniref:sterol desaturase family protein n=1 Tax=Bradyrhizobium sp. TaxID=376 RepID=UPI001D9BC277|nr:sterol desaturase family protein [Bradyrhizobium sp.]MBV9562927.1 sterol desaturase family protein [Bradyrhizobium sp.]
MDISFVLHPQFRAVVAATAIGLMLLEYGLGRLANRHSHDWRESVASFGVALGQNLLRGLEAGLVAIPFVFLYQHRLLDFAQTGPLAIAGLFLGSEFLYYWQHRASHRIRWMWATHAVHHSPTRLNLTAAIRLGWTGNISGNFLFFLPLALIGFHPLATVAMLGVNLLYQFFIHTEFAPRLGALEWMLNTPSHHRVHHASNAACLDRNYGGILIVFDRLFGTFAEAPAGESLRYGLVGGEPTFNPFRIAFGEWIAMLRDAWHAQGARARLRALFGPPGA